MSSRTPSTFRTLAQLFRLPAVFTAMSDIAMGALVAQAWAATSPSLTQIAILLLASSCIYLAGMVLNDVADAKTDERERPHRPIPSGRISRGVASILGGALLALGFVCVCFIGIDSRTPLTICGALILAVLVYDFIPAKSRLRLLLMPTCRVLNVLLGMSTVDAATLPWDVRCWLAGIVGVYILGITVFARDEAGRSKPKQLWAGAALMAAAIAVSLLSPAVIDRAQTSVAYPYLLVILAWQVALPASRAIQQPQPARVQATVRSALQGIIILDAALACALAGGVGLLVLVLLVPNWYSGRWLSST